MGERCEVGVLCIHGMGQQRRGQTVETPARTIHRWLESWFGARGGASAGTAQIRQASLAETQLEGSEPASAVLEVCDPDGNKARWLFAESWWAADFEAPPIASLGWWMLTRGAAVVVSHLALGVLLMLPPAFLIRVGRDLEGLGAAMRSKPDVPYTPGMIVRGWLWLALLHFPVGPMLFVLVLVPTVVLQLLTLVLVTLALIPIHRLQSLIQGVLLVLRSVLGDGFQFTMNSAVRTSILTHVHRDLEWLAARCNRVIVLAHSQGAAVAYQALVDLRDLADAYPEARPRVEKLITYGLGLAKLEQMRRANHTPLALAALLAVPYLLACRALFERAMMIDLGLSWLFYWGVLLLPMLGTTLVVLYFAIEAMRINDELRTGFQKALPDVRWIRLSREPRPRAGTTARADRPRPPPHRQREERAPRPQFVLGQHGRVRRRRRERD